MLPYLFDRPSDPRIGPASPLADFGGDFGDDPFAAAATAVESPAPPSAFRTALADASPVRERRLERIVERTREVPLAAPRPADPVAHQPVRKDMDAATPAPAAIVTTTIVSPGHPEPARSTVPPPAQAAARPVPRDMSPTLPTPAPYAPTRHVAARMGYGRHVAAAPRPEATDLAPRPIVSPEAHIEAKPLAPAPSQPAPVPAVAAVQPVARLEPRRRDPGPPIAETCRARV
jgi:hypothetical protein